MMSILDEIFAHKREEVAAARRALPFSEVRQRAEMTAAALPFAAALRRPDADAPLRLIAEVKCASPSRGILVPDFDPQRLARTYRQAGAAAISVLTDKKYFKGSLAYLQEISAQTPRLPVLRKDFILDTYQVYEARAAGADAVLLIAAYLDLPIMADLYTQITSLGMSALVEVHNRAELDKALNLKPALLGINNRDLHDFSVCLDTCINLRALIAPETVVVAESGIHTGADVARLKAAGLDAMLVGEALVTAPDTFLKIKELLA
ncbi:MAG: indole-3-glycerol phosphate synthase TrpC [Anaerolineae bacterium]|nr:indole-3-glycerol phosphate synthase TrpC [Anaerolineae bacterium]